ncbi:MAG: YlbF family regulator [Lachnospiraceae bacterium]|nr:YlbF family regulator [Lachnospiraceae bacterium]
MDILKFGGHSKDSDNTEKPKEVTSPTINEAVDILVERLFNTPEYQLYLHEKERVKGDEICIDKIHRYREITYELQNLSPERKFRDGKRLESELDELGRDVRVSDFLQAEVDFARIYQDIIKRILNRIELD